MAAREDVVKIGFDIDMSELTKLTSSLDGVKKTLSGGVGDDAFDEMIRESKRASEGMNGVKDSIDGIKSDALDDTVRGLKDTDKNADRAHEGLKKIASTTFDKTVTGLKKITSTLGTVAVQAGKVIAKGIAVGVAGVGALVTKSVMNFADYEQLVGGVDTLFKGASGAVQKNAANAFNTAGLSANAYMETVTSFSASLIQSLGGDTTKAADYANKAIVDMADNANKMGTDMGSIQDAYQGFAKQNYTMLDNLKLGYGGTQEEMKRLLKDAEKISGQKFDLSSYADVVQAIHVIQENMGIAGTTSEEASKTISGSWASMKAAWSNTLTALIIGGDTFDQCVDNLVESAKTFGKNIMPAIQKALFGVGELITELAPIVEKELPGIIDTLLPPLIKAATSLVKGLIVALPDIVSTLAKELPGVLSQLWDGIKEAFGEIPGMKKMDGFFSKLNTWLTENSGIIKKVIPGIIGLVAAFKVFNKIKGLTGLFGGGGGAGGGFFSSLASMKPTIALKGMANLAIIIGGLGIIAAAVMAVSPYLAKLSDLKSVAELLAVITAVGIVGAAMSKLAGSVGNIPVATVAKGLANIAIVMVGFGALAAALMWVAPYMAQLSDLKTTMQLLLVIAAVGIVGAALTALSGVVGAIPAAVVTTGLANIAIVLGGFTAIVAAFGALGKIDGFNDFIGSGGETLSTLCGIIGEMAGSLIGGLGEGITNSLPTIGENLSAFATSLQPMFDTFAGVDVGGLSDFAGALAAFIAVIAGEKIVSVITGGIDYEGLGTKLSGMATSLSTFFATITTFPEEGFAKATALFDCLAGISSMPKEGGVMGWFQGEVNYGTMATGLNQLARAAGFFTTIQSIPEAAFTAATNLFNCLGGIKALPKDGGVTQWFTGTVSFDTIASGIQTLASGDMVAALTTIGNLPAAAFTGLTSMFDALAGVKAMPSEGGIAGWFSGDASTALNNIASKLPGVATHIANFFSNLGGITDFTPIKSLFETLGNIEISSDAAEGTGFLGLGASQLEQMGSGLAGFASSAAGFFSAINGLNLTNLQGFFTELSTMGDLPTAITSINTTLGATLTLMVTTVSTKMTEIKTAISTGMTDCVTSVNSQAAAFYSAGVFVMQGLNDGMLSMQETLIATATAIANAVSSALEAALDINSPSRVTFKTGAFTGEGMNLGMQSKIPSIRATANAMGNAAIPYSCSYSPDADAGTVYNSGGNSEYTSVAPVFNLTISGSQDDRATARKVKQWVAEAFQEIIDSMDRKTPTVREA